VPVIGVAVSGPLAEAVGQAKQAPLAVTMFVVVSQVSVDAAHFAPSQKLPAKQAHLDEFTAKVFESVSFAQE
jgi:hypothetical protein